MGVLTIIFALTNTTSIISIKSIHFQEKINQLFCSESLVFRSYFVYRINKNVTLSMVYHIEHYDVHKDCVLFLRYSYKL